MLETRKRAPCWRNLLAAAGILLSGLNHAAGLLSPSDKSLPPLEIKSHRVSVVIEDSYAVTTVAQVFHNPHDRDLEAIYSFPVPEHGTVSDFTLWIDGQAIIGEVVEKREARRVYEEEKAAGRDAGITEKDGYKTFDVSVSPVRARQDTRIRLTYLQAAHIDTGIGRYVYPLEEGGVDEQKLAFWTANEKVTEQFNFDLVLRSSYPVDAVRFPNQPNAQINQLSDAQWQISLAHGRAVNEEGAATEANVHPLAGRTHAATLDRDLVVYWRHRPGLPGSVDLVAYKPDAAERGTFMLVVTPGDDLQAITEGRDWVFVLDISGSMKGKYASLADGVEQALGKLSPNDRFRIVLFNNQSRELTHGYTNATQEAVLQYGREIANIQPGSGTNLYAGLQQGLQALEADRTSGIVLVTDGVANVGETQQRKFIELIRQKDTRLFTFIMGNSANRPLLEAMTKASGGFAASISNSDDIVGQLLNAVSKVTHEALHGVELQIDGVKTANLTPTQIGSLYRGQQLVVFGHYWDGGLADVKLRGEISGTGKTYHSQFEFPFLATENPELERLWGFAAVEDLQAEMEDFGEQADLKEAATDIALEYSLVTDFTSLLVLREEQFAARSIERHNQRRLAVEQAAQQRRAQRAPVSRRVDQQQPMYHSPRPSHSGGSGAIDAWSLLLMLPLLATIVLGRRAQGHPA